MERTEIVKALECCVSGYCFRDDCPLCERGGDDDIKKCTTELAKNALALIKELAEENERLRTQVEMWKSTAYCEKDRGESTKADTVRKMQERVKSELNDCCRYIWNNREYFIVGEELIDQIAKEMLECEDENT